MFMRNTTFCNLKILKESIYGIFQDITTKIQVHNFANLFDMPVLVFVDFEIIIYRGKGIRICFVMKRQRIYNETLITEGM